MVKLVMKKSIAVRICRFIKKEYSKRGVSNFDKCIQCKQIQGRKVKVTRIASKPADGTLE